jgi:flavin reductase (DIM6/NTAB) family NADH-FMN oxidoreductase RutF
MDKHMSSALRKLEYGVYVVSMGKGTAGNAFTASWVSQVSSEPPMVALAVHNKHQSSRLLESHGAFVINLLALNHAEVARTYYGPAESGYAKLKDSQVLDAPATGTAMINGTDGFLDCKIVSKVAVGNHTLFIAEVMAAELTNDSPALTTSNSKLHYAG